MDHKDLDVWKFSMDLVESIYSFTSILPDTERYGLVSQMRRAVISIPSNIAEGSGRRSDKELSQYVSIALGSLAELETQYLITVRLGYASANNALENMMVKVRQLLLGYRNYVRGKT